MAFMLSRPESVEAPHMQTLLRDLGMDYAQGFGVGRPLGSIEEIVLQGSDS